MCLKPSVLIRGRELNPLYCSVLSIFVLGQTTVSAEDSGLYGTTDRFSAPLDTAERMLRKTSNTQRPNLAYLNSTLDVERSALNTFYPSAWSRSSTKSSAFSRPMDNRSKPSGEVVPGPSMDARCSIKLSTPPKLVARMKIFVFAASDIAAS